MISHSRRFLLPGLCLLWLLASGDQSAIARPYWVYVGTFQSAKQGGIYMARLDDSGHLGAPQLAAVTESPAFLAVDPTDRHLYAAIETASFLGQKAGGVSAFALDAATGHLTPLNRRSTVAPGPAHIALDASGHLAVTANYAGSSVTVFPIAADGNLGAASDFIRQHGSSVNPDRQREPHAHETVFAPDNRFAFVCDLGLDRILAFHVDAANGKLTPNDPPFTVIAPGSGPRHLAFAPDGHVAYLISEMACTVTVLAYDRTHGSFSERQIVSLLPPGVSPGPALTAAEVVVHPSGRYLYASVRGSDQLVVMGIDETTGRLNVIERVPSGGHIPRNFNLDPEGHFLLCANQDSNNVVVFLIDPKTGRLEPSGQSIAVIKPTCVVFVPARS